MSKLKHKRVSCFNVNYIDPRIVSQLQILKKSQNILESFEEKQLMKCKHLYNIIIFLTHISQEDDVWKVIVSHIQNISWSCCDHKHVQTRPQSNHF